MPALPSAITYEVMVDWDSLNWAGTPDFTQAIDDISADVAYIDTARGKNSEEGNAPAATLQIRLKAGLCSNYSPFNAAGDYYNKIRPWLPVRIRAIHATVAYPVFFGFLSRITIDPHPDRQAVTMYVTDGTDLLARQLIAQDYDDKTVMSDGEALTAILDAAGWSLTRRDIDTDGGDNLLQYPSTYTY